LLTKHRSSDNSPGVCQQNTGVQITNNSPGVVIHYAGVQIIPHEFVNIGKEFVSKTKEFK
jgi:hypothetical protein